MITNTSDRNSNKLKWQIMKYTLIFIVLFSLFLFCKKETNIDIMVYNYVMGEPVANATIVFLEQSGTKA